MNDKETRILEEPQTLLNLGSAYTKAREEYLSELARDCERSDGSGVQEARRDVHQNELRKPSVQQNPLLMHRSNSLPD
ncbi:Uncharacterised protein [Tatumella ptyseos]|uniref:Uncharacterized protein n=1 Tax=Tatumella ptyseos TaxID=82987 RepID=A0A2X5PCG2_9GAMM|nr:Uncharacterised protein [Tatumella ptyseos]